MKKIQLIILFGYSLQTYAQRIHSSDFDYDYDGIQSFGFVEGIMSIIGIVLMLIAYSFRETKKTLSWILGIIGFLLLNSALRAIINLIPIMLDYVITYGLILAAVVFVIWFLDENFK